MRPLRRGTSAAALKRLSENVLCLRLLGHDRPGATNFGLGAAGNDTRIGPGNQNWSVWSENSVGCVGAEPHIARPWEAFGRLKGCAAMAF